MRQYSKRKSRKLFVLQYRRPAVLSFWNPPPQTRWDEYTVGAHYLWLHIREFAYLPKFTCNLKFNTRCAFSVFHGLEQSIKKFESLGNSRSQLGLSKATLCLWSQLSCCKLASSLMAYLVPHFPHGWAFWWWFLCLRWLQAQGCRAAWSPECKEAATCLMEKTRALEKFHSCATGYEFSVTESTIYIEQSVFNQKYTVRKTRLCIDWLMKMWPEPGSNLTLCFPSTLWSRIC